MFVIALIPLVAILFYVVYSRSRYENKSNAGAFFFENNSLVLNTGVPYSIPFHEIEYVELKYNPWELEHKMSYSRAIRVVKNDGKTKQVFYKGYRTAQLALLSDMKAVLEEKGIRCVVLDR